MAAGSVEWVGAAPRTYPLQRESQAAYDTSVVPGPGRGAGGALVHPWLSTVMITHLKTVGNKIVFTITERLPHSCQAPRLI